MSRGSAKPPDQILGDAVVAFLRRAASAWARGDDDAAETLTAAAWRIVGDGEFCDPPARPEHQGSEHGNDAREARP